MLTSKKGQPEQLEQPAIVLSTTSPSERYVVGLTQLMEEEKLYRNPDLGRKLIADRLSISEGYVSKMMSNQIGESFADFVTRYRIEEACELLNNPTFDRYSLEAIGLESGFKSRSASYLQVKSIRKYDKNEFGIKISLQLKIGKNET